MSGYIGTKAVTLSTTAANVGGDSTVGGDLTVDTNTLHVDSANNRVGVGTATPSTAILDIFTASSSQDGLKINRFATGTYYSTLRQDTHGLAIHVGDGSAISERAAITPYGITFNGDTAAANALDDYEEGTWTPSTNVNGFSQSISSLTQTTYVKIGKIVHITFAVNLSASGYASNYSHFLGLPYSSQYAGTNGRYAGGSISAGGDGSGVYISGSDIYLFPSHNTSSASWTTTWNVSASYLTA